MVLLFEIISREQEQSSINGFTGRNLTAQRDCSKLVLYRGQGLTNSGRPRTTDLKGLDQGRCSEGRSGPSKEWDVYDSKAEHFASFNKQLMSQKQREDTHLRLLFFRSMP